MRELEALFPRLVQFYGAKVLSVPLSLAYLSVLAKTLGPAGFGDLAVILGIGQLLYYGAAAWSEPALLRFGREEMEREGTLQRTVAARTALASGCFVFAAAAVALAGPRLGGATAATPAVLAGALAWGAAFSASNAAVFLLRVAGRLRESAAASVCRHASSLILLAPMALGWLPRVPAMAIAVEVAASGCTLAYAAWCLRGRRAWPPRWDGPLLRRLTAYCAPVIVIYLAGYVSEWGHLFVINRYFSREDVGVYAAVGRVVGHAQLILMSLYTLLVPALVSLRTQQRYAWVERYAREGIALGSWAWTLVLVLAWALARPLLAVMLGPSYAGQERLFSILVAAAGWQLITVLAMCQFLAADALEVPVRISVLCELCLQLTALVAAAAAFGRLEAVAWAMWVSRAASAWLAWSWLGRLVCRGSAHALAFPAVLGVLAAAGPVTDGARALAALAVVAGLLVWARAVRLMKPEDMAWLERMQVPIMVRKRVAFLAG